MGGQSSGTWAVAADGYGIFDGEVKDVPSLSAPGFIKAAADGSFNDASAAIDGNLVLTVRTTSPEYKGFRVSFASGTSSPSYACSGGGGIPFSRGCFKAQFDVPAGDDFVEVAVPFNMFSDLWSSATGEQTTTCAEDASACPTAEKLAAIQRVEVWAEGADGAVHLELLSVAAATAAAPKATAGADVTLVSFSGASTRHATPRHATPRHATPRRAASPLPRPAHVRTRTQTRTRARSPHLTPPLLSFPPPQAWTAPCRTSSR